MLCTTGFIGVPKETKNTTSSNVGWHIEDTSSRWQSSSGQPYGCYLHKNRFVDGGSLAILAVYPILFPKSFLLFLVEKPSPVTLKLPSNESQDKIPSSCEVGTRFNHFKLSHSNIITKLFKRVEPRV